jgi:crotonobetainyl-CoA:carnitine CoA-transferase CaiB-like acyl-CoA transferase
MAGPLRGLKILDFTTLLPGPYATMLLADMGAEVLRIVSPSRPDLVDFFPPMVPGTKLSAAAAYLGRNKRNMALNLKDPRAIAVVHRLLGKYDVVIEQFRPGVMAKLGLDYEALAKVNPKVVYCSITGYGQTGPLVDRAGHDINYIARSGVSSYTGKKATGPSLVSMQIADVASGSNHAVIGILAAVFGRQQTGKGQFVDISMTDGMIAFNAMFGAAFLVDGKEPGFEGNLLNGGSLYDYYETKDGRYLSCGPLEPQFFANFCKTLGRPDWIAGTVSPKNIAQVKEEVRAIFRTKTLAEWVTLFNATDACTEPVLTMGEAFADPLAAAREMVVEVPLPAGDKVRQLGCPIKFSATKPEFRHVGVPAGTDTAAVLREAGYSDAEIGEMEAAGLFR